MYASIVALLLATAGGECSLTVKVTDLPSDKGVVRFFLADTKSSYGEHDRGTGVAEAAITPASGLAIWSVGPLPCGDYAIRAHHDEDGDGKLGHNFVGMPTESYAFSNDARGFMGPPSWEEAKFTLAAPQTVTLKATR